MATVHVSEKVLDGFGCLRGIEFECDDAVVGVQFDHDVSCVDRAMDRWMDR
jgi:hypothetical protein